MKPNNYLVFTWKKKKHAGMSRFQTREACFVPFSLLDAVSDSSPVEPRCSRRSLSLKGALCVFCHLSQTDPSWLWMKVHFVFVCLTEFVKDVIHRPTCRSNSVWSHFQTRCNNCSHLCYDGQNAGCVLLRCFFCHVFRLYFDIWNLILFRLYMLSVDSIKTTTAKKIHISMSFWPHTATLRWYWVIHVASVPTPEAIKCWFSECFLKQNEPRGPHLWPRRPLSCSNQHCKAPFYQCKDSCKL